MARRYRASSKTNKEMNLTPMMDLTFLLLITFIITFPLIEQGIPVNLPKGKAQLIQTDTMPALVSIDKEGRMFLGADSVTMETLEQRLRILFSETPDLRMTLRGDTDVNYGTVVAVARLATDIGIKHLAMATQE